MKINSLYVGVKDMNRAIDFYKNLFQKEPEDINERFSSFDINGITFALYNAKADSEDMTFGNNCVPNIEIDNAEDEYQRVKELNAELLGEIVSVDSYKLFQFKDTEGNVIEFYEVICK